MSRSFALTALLLSALSSGCVGAIRETTTARTASEMLLVSTAAERAVSDYSTDHLRGKRVFVDDTRFESIDKPYVMSALRDRLDALAHARHRVPQVGHAAGRDRPGPVAAGPGFSCECRSLPALASGSFLVILPSLESARLLGPRLFTGQQRLRESRLVQFDLR